MRRTASLKMATSYCAHVAILTGRDARESATEWRAATDGPMQRRAHLAQGEGRRWRAQFRVQACTPYQSREGEPQAGRLCHHEGEEAGRTGLWPVIGAGAILPLPATRTIRRGGRSEERCLDRLGMTREGAGGALGGPLARGGVIILKGPAGAGREGLAQLHNHDMAIYALMAAL